ncbi:hypothetical protein AX16_007292 [Volvariella volvacea WC 439]|nr:hypothetical protein AX16_007292 [Volvariella volvacea WC 439]
MPVETITSYEQFKQVTNAGQPAVIDFWATWCGPCRAISPVFEKLSNVADYAGVKFYKVDVDALTDVAQEVGIRAMPTFVAFKDGSKVKEVVGARPQELQHLISHAAASS